MGKISDFIKGVALPQQKARQALALDAEFSNLLAKVPKLEAEILKLQAEVNPLQRTIEAQEQKIAQLTSSGKDSLSFDQSTGTYIDANSPIRYCAICRDGHKRTTPLRNDTYGWFCQICRRGFDDPTRPPPLISFNAEPLA